ncbi:emp24/gp25L/p24 family protein [Lujinxingia vulgaris]|uniref:Emp24/gp25L/p24 family protein n=2 Tax=Lujinxingia TaxID=2653226 RepID=A0A5C6XED8_9DELT|nr:MULTISPECIES: hypothetical protein [Lujinxingia]RDV38823.1 hypothetical protein DV096_08480 [Bradymonadaceae bacterium TMQ3]TXC76405.1 emp24/gp25L/p24 family protein [Bradymonadales bacterium TMQ1]RVU44057.1 hypothetical protein EA187_10915 [Lujinxingia sediminis]TXD35748.1 emp24/gp25L/p24 family protein [Lujinxingia vulgaris]TXD38483.1 emp24/gp25L/p24 family protein [Lujinxingia vulgaris]
MASWKDDLVNNALKALQSPTAQKIMNNEKVQKGVSKAFRASFEIKNGLDEKRDEFAKRFNLATRDDLRTMKRELDRLNRQVDSLKRAQKKNTDNEG